MLAFARHRLLDEVPELIVLLLCRISFVKAWFSWRFVEKPFTDNELVSRRFLSQCVAVSVYFFDKRWAISTPKKWLPEAHAFSSGFFDPSLNHL